MSDILVEVAEAVPVEVNLPAKDNAIEMEVYYQDEVSLDTDLSLLYVKSGEKEIENYVEGVAKPEIDGYIQEYAKPIVSEVVDSIATPIIDEYFEETVKPSISQFAEEEMAVYAQTATEQAGIATAAAAEASTTAQAVDVKVAEFSEQTEVSKQEFIAFAGEKTEEFEQTAQQATADSLANAEKSRIWAEGEQAEVETLGGELSSMGAADLAYAIANAPEDTPIDASGLFAMNVVKGEKGDKGDKGDAGKDGKDGVDGTRLPAGTINPFAGNTVPDGWLKCDGSAISRTTYADLFAVIGTTYGTGDGSTTFNIPNFTNARFVTSATVAVKGNGRALGVVNSNNVLCAPNLRGTGDSNYYGGWTKYEDGALTASSHGASGVYGRGGLTTDASKSGITGTASLASACSFIIKY